MWFMLILILGILGLGFWMWKRPDPVERDQAKAVQHDLWLDQIDAQLKHAEHLSCDQGQPNYARAYDIYSQLAKQHELPQAYTQMGLMHLYGLGREKNPPHGIGLLEKAYRLGGDEAAYQLGIWHETQLQDSEKALYWYRHAVALGHLDAQYRINGLSNPNDLVSEQHLSLLKRNAENGHASSQYQLAQYYLTQIKTPNISEGLHALFQAAEQGHLVANQQLYEYYQFGQFLPANEQCALHYLKVCIALGDQALLPIYQQAVLMGKYDIDQRQRVWSDLLTQAKEHQNLKAKALLGRAYFHGWFVDKNETMAFRYWSEAAQEKNAEALCAIAALYYEEHLVAKTPEKAFELYQYAHEIEPNYMSLMGLGLCHLHGVGTVQDIAKAEAYLQQVAEQGWRYKIKNSADQNYVIGLFYCMASYPLPDRNKALAYLVQASEQGCTDALWTLYQLYAGQLISTVNDFEQAQICLQQAADAGHVLAQVTLGLGLSQDDHSQQNLLLAQQYLKQAAIQGNGVALNRLGEIYTQGLGQEADLNVALEYYQQAAQHANPDAYGHLGQMYLYGQGVERNLHSAQCWLEKGRAMRHPRSIELLKNIEAYLNQESKF